MPLLPDPDTPPVDAIWQKNPFKTVIQLDGCCENDHCLTVTQQALIAGFYGAVQMEMALSLRRLLAKNKTLLSSFADAVEGAWNATYPELVGRGRSKTTPPSKVDPE
jgi:hypothetical protein